LIANFHSVTIESGLRRILVGPKTSPPLPAIAAELAAFVARRQALHV
jgi:hypothetical protein